MCMCLWDYALLNVSWLAAYVKLTRDRYNHSPSFPADVPISLNMIFLRLVCIMFLREYLTNFTSSTCFNETFYKQT